MPRGVLAADNAALEEDAEPPEAAAGAAQALVFPNASPATTHGVVSELIWKLLPGGCVMETVALDAGAAVLEGANFLYVKSMTQREENNFFDTVSQVIDKIYSSPHGPQAFNRINISSDSDYSGYMNFLRPCLKMTRST